MLIGFTDPVNEMVWDDLETGFSLTVEDPFNLLREKPKTRYPQWEPVTLTAKVPDTPHQTLYFYVNGTFCGKGVRLDDHYQFTMTMPGAHATVLITPEEQKLKLPSSRLRRRAVLSVCNYFRLTQYMTQPSRLRVSTISAPPASKLARTSAARSAIIPERMIRPSAFTQRSR